MLYDSLSQNLVASVCATFCWLARHKTLIHDVLSLSIFALQKQLSYVLEAFRSVWIGIVCLTSAPHRYLVEDDVLLLDSAVYHHAKAAIAKRQPLLPCLRRGVVPKLLLQFSLCRLHIDIVDDENVRRDLCGHHACHAGQDAECCHIVCFKNDAATCCVAVLAAPEEFLLCEEACDGDHDQGVGEAVDHCPCRRCESLSC